MTQLSFHWIQKKKTFDEYKQHFMDESSRVNRNRRDIIRIVERKPRFNVNLEEEKFKAIPLKRKRSPIYSI